MFTVFEFVLNCLVVGLLGYFLAGWFGVVVLIAINTLMRYTISSFRVLYHIAGTIVIMALLCWPLWH